MRKIVIDKDLLYKIYVKENHNMNETTNILNNEHNYNVSQRTVQRQIKEYNFNKDLITISKSRKQTNINKYGVENVYQTKDVIDKCKETKLDRYGSETYNNLEQQQKTNLERYGVKCVFNTDEVKNKIINKYGGIGFKSKIIQNKCKQTNLKRYKVEFPFQSKEIINKAIKNQRNNHNGKLAWNTEKQKQTMLEKYGKENIGFSNNKTKQTMLDKYGVEYTVHNKELFNKMKQTNLKRYGVEYACLTENCINNNYGSISKINQNFSKLLNKNNINNKLEFRLKNKSYDIHILDTNILIEINPTYTHNSTIGPYFNGKRLDAKEHNYHFNKTKLARENNYHCIHIFDWDDQDKIINMLKNKNKIFARNCEIRIVEQKETNEFLDKYHLQSSLRVKSINLGLYYNDELIEIMTFGKPRYNKNYEYELLRLCTKSEYSITGGSEKLFKYFIKEYSPKSIISYCDNSKFSGDVYNKLGFNLKTFGNPSKHWYNGDRHITDNLLRQQGFDRLFNANFGKGTNNEELMIEHSFVEVYDCGQSVYIWRNNEY